jgi:drug/metabolite transporter (DMT)-like permease
VPLPPVPARITGGPTSVLSVSAVCFGAAVLPSQWATEAGLTAAAAVSIRFLVASAAVAPSVLRARPALGPRWRLYLLGWLVSGGVNTGGFLLLTTALETTSAATGAFLGGLGVLIVPLMVAVVTRRLPAPARLLAVFLAVLGSLVLTGGSVSLTTGALLAIASAVVGSLHILSVGFFAPRLDLGLYNLGQLVVVAVVTGVWALTGDPSTVTVAGVAAAAFTGLAQAAGLTLQGLAQRAVDGSTAALIFTMVPVVALLSAWALDGQTPGGGEVVGGLLIVLAVVVGERGARLLTFRTRALPALPRSGDAVDRDVLPGAGLPAAEPL